MNRPEGSSRSQEVERDPHKRAVEVPAYGEGCHPVANVKLPVLIHALPHKLLTSRLRAPPVLYKRTAAAAESLDTPLLIALAIATKEGIVVYLCFIDSGPIGLSRGIEIRTVAETFDGWELRCFLDGYILLRSFNANVPPLAACSSLYVACRVN